MLLSLLIVDASKMAFPAIEFDPEYDDARAVISAICEGIEDSGIATFQVSGFGDAVWPVDISTDLVTLIEQLPSVLCTLDQREGEFCIDFYEQGIERLIFGHCSGDMTTLRCQSRTNWEPKPAVVEMRSADLSAMLSSIHRQFLSLALATPMPDSARKSLIAWAFPRSVAA